MAEIILLGDANWWPAMMSGWGGFFAIFAALGLVFFLIARIIVHTPSREDLRLEQIRPESAAEAAHAKPAFGTWTQALAAQIPESEKERRDFELLLRQAGMYAPMLRNRFMRGVSSCWWRRCWWPASARSLPMPSIRFRS